MTIKDLIKYEIKFVHTNVGTLRCYFRNNKKDYYVLDKTLYESVQFGRYSSITKRSSDWKVHLEDIYK